ncbi:DUF2169 domain-containing protein [Xanthobacter sediminis]
MRYIVSVVAAFDLADPSRLDGEQSLWAMLAQVLPPGAALDASMPKPRAELLIGGRLQAPQTRALMLEAEVGDIRRRFAVFGDRWWSSGPDGDRPTPAQPIADLLLEPARAFGGASHPVNPQGAGHDAARHMGKGKPVPLPNIENADALVQSIADDPAPARFGPLDVFAPERRMLAGTYDQAWAETLAPALPDDIHPDFFMVAPPEQRFSGYLNGDEPYRLRNFSAGEVEISGRLPAVRPRVFVGCGERSWVELAMRLDTLWLLAGARRGVLVWHGMTRVEDIEGKDVTDVLLGYERMADPPRPVSHYAEVRRLRTDPETAFRHAFSESQLAPPRDPAEDARRRAARMELARERAAAHAEVMAFVMERQLDGVDVPAGLRPPPPEPSDDLLLLPTGEELAEGDFDLGELLDAIEEKHREADEKLQALSKVGAGIRSAMEAVERPGAGPSDVDALLAALSSPMETDLAAELDQSLGQVQVPVLDLPVPTPDLPDGMPLPPEAAAAMDKVVELKASQELTAAMDEIAALKDWRSMVLEGFARPDDEALLKEAHARFLDLPETRPFADMRAGLAAASSLPPIDLPPIDLPDIQLPPDVPKPGASAPAPAAPIASLLDRLADPGLPEMPMGDVAQKLTEADAAVAAQLPHLKPAPGGFAIDALLAEMEGAAGLKPDDRTPEEKLAELKAGMAEIQTLAAGGNTDMSDFEAQLNDAEDRMKEATAQARRMSPMPGYPQKMLSPRLARQFGDLVLADIRAGVDLRGRDLAGIDLAGADLTGLDLSGAFLERANLANARLRGAKLVETVLAGARLVHADLSDTDLSDANLAGVDGTSANLSGARLRRTQVMRARLPGAALRGATLSDISAIEIELDGADLVLSRCDEVTFIKSTFRNARFDRALLRQCQFVECDLSGAAFDGAFLDRCALVAVTAPDVSAVQADLRGSSFVGGVDLSRADFSAALASDCAFHGANLVAARFHRATLDRASMAEAKLAGASFRLASMQETLLDSSDLRGADLVGAHLLDAKLHRANLARATLRGANLHGADMMDAELPGADLSGANLAKTVLALETRNA